MFILRYPSITQTGRIQEAHLYFIKKSLIDYEIDNDKSLKINKIIFIL